MIRSEFVEKAKKRVGKTGHDLFEKYKVKTDWCMMMVYDLMHDTAGISAFPKTFSCSGFTSTNFARPRINHDFKTAEIGDIITFEINGNRDDGSDHVGIVIDNTDGTITLLEGNTKGNGYPYFDNSTANIFEYPYYASCFDCIVDMSDFFTDDALHPPNASSEDEEPTEVKTFQPEKRRYLQLGSKGTDVKKIQRLLFFEGYDVGADDGDFGTRTDKYVREFQHDHKLDVDGIVGHDTFEELMK